MAVHRIAPLTVGLVAALSAWGAFCAWCVSGFPPAVDLPAHAAQIQTLAELLRGAPAVSQFYRASFPLGYGLTTWLFAPVALVTNGAFAARLGLWLTLMLFPVSLLALARELGRSQWTALAATPFAFSISYWFGFLPTLFATPFVFLYWSLLLAWIRSGRRALLLALFAVGSVVALSHIAMFGPLFVGALALAFTSRERRHTAFTVALTSLPGLAICSLFVLTRVLRSDEASQGAKFDFDVGARLNWLPKAYGSVGAPLFWASLAGALLFVAFAFISWRRAGRPAIALVASMLVLYALTPKAFGGAWLIHVRFGVCLGIAPVMLCEFTELPRWARVVVAGLSVVVLVSVARIHLWFASAMGGLADVTAVPPPAGLHGGHSLEGLTLPGTKLRFLEHAAQWWTAKGGGVGTNFFADAEHQPVRYAKGQLPTLVELPAAAELKPFSALLIYGDGPLPDVFSDFEVRSASGKWRRLERRQ